MFHDPEFWVLIAFVVFIAAVGKKAWAMITGMLDGRAAAIKSELESAVALREEAQTLLAGYQRQQRDAVKETEVIVEQAKQTARIETEQAKADLESALERRGKSAADKIAQAKARALEQIRANVVDVTIAATRRVIAESMDDARSDALVDEAIAAGLASRLRN
ncbi:MAG TPA: F0F1 ATP synthase subunit B [Alphaproteobacteria bacterium]|jgi:F-type H+-transporting ATPase subunit b|nr:F0F1 ATP synthase subunit B [Alphaproteobacteria bacterium]